MQIGKEWIFIVSQNYQNDITSVVDKCKLGINMSREQQIKVKQMLIII